MSIDSVLLRKHRGEDVINYYQTYLLVVALNRGPSVNKPMTYEKRTSMVKAEAPQVLSWFTNPINTKKPRREPSDLRLSMT